MNPLRRAFLELGLIWLVLLVPTMTRSQEITASLQPFVDSHSLAGAVTLVANKDRVLDLATVGFADVAAQKLMTTDHLFWIASQSKPITATALMMLVDAGKLQLDDPVAQYLPEFRHLWLARERDEHHILLNRPSRPITIRDILSHTSGLPFSSAMETPTLDGLSLRDAARSYAMTPLLAEPGVKYQYANAGINTAGRIIEVVAGQSYEQFLESKLFQPLGMSDTTFWPTLDQQQRLARSYQANPSKDGLAETTITQLRYPLDDRTRHPMPAGGLFSTAADLARFCRMILNDGTLDGHRYLSGASVGEMIRKQTGPDLKESYGLGWSVNGREAGHGGAYATNMTIDRARGLILIYLVQHASFPNNGDQAQAAFRRAALARFGPGQP